MIWRNICVESIQKIINDLGLNGTVFIVFGLFLFTFLILQRTFFDSLLKLHSERRSKMFLDTDKISEIKHTIQQSEIKYNNEIKRHKENEQDSLTIEINKLKDSFNEAVKIKKNEYTKINNEFIEKIKVENTKVASKLEEKIPEISEEIIKKLGVAR